MKHRIPWIVTLGALLLLTACAQPGQNAAAEQTVTVGRDTLRLTISGSGTVQAADSADVTFAATGTISDVLVREGEQVEQNQPLARLDTDLLQTQVDAAQAQRDSAQAQRDSAQAQRDSAQAQRDSAQAQVDRIEEAEDEGNSRALGIDTSDAAKTQARAQVDQADAQIRQADAQVQQAEAGLRQAEAQLRQAQLSLEEATVRAPIAGTVIAVNIAPGDTTTSSASAGATGGSGAPFTIADTSRYVVEATINEADIAQVRDDQTAQVTIDALGTEPITGTVDYIASTATVEQNVTSYRVDVALPPDVEGVRIGMNASVEINQEAHPNVLVVPSSAIRSEGNQRIVRLRQGEQFVDHPIQTGLSNDVDTEVVGGLNEGDVIAAVGTPNNE